MFAGFIPTWLRVSDSNLHAFKRRAVSAHVTAIVLSAVGCETSGGMRTCLDNLHNRVWARVQSCDRESALCPALCPCPCKQSRAGDREAYECLSGLRPSSF